MKFMTDQKIRDPKEIEKKLIQLEKVFREQLQNLYKKCQSEISEIFKDIEQKRIDQLKKDSSR